MSNSNRAIIVDDSDPTIQYLGRTWFQDVASQDRIGNFGPTFQHTLHGTKANASFSFKFEGLSLPFGNVVLIIYPPILVQDVPSKFLAPTTA